LYISSGEARRWSMEVMMDIEIKCSSFEKEERKKQK
jgi:hypothetical protein